jgi:hypothetical protein
MNIKTNSTVETNRRLAQKKTYKNGINMRTQNRVG